MANPCHWARLAAARDGTCRVEANRLRPDRIARATKGVLQRSMVTQTQVVISPQAMSWGPKLQLQSSGTATTNPHFLCQNFKIEVSAFYNLITKHPRLFEYQTTSDGYHRHALSTLMAVAEPPKMHTGTTFRVPQWQNLVQSTVPVDNVFTVKHRRAQWSVNTPSAGT